MEDIDRLANRVTAVAFSGFLVGASIAILRGRAVPRNALNTAASCALAGTACFGTERLSHVGLTLLFPGDGTKETQNKRLFVSHGMGGVLGGSVVGYLFVRRPSSGILLFTPLMLVVAGAELVFEQKRREHIQQAKKNVRQPKTAPTDGKLESQAQAR